MAEGVHGEAVITDDGVYRYLLRRWWGVTPRPPTMRRVVCWIMLNPSTADGLEDDPTIKRCISFSRAWGYDALNVVNLFSFRTPYPYELARVSDPIGPMGNFILRRTAEDANLVIAAWGAHPIAGPRGRVVREMLRQLQIPLHHLGLTKSGHPKHPLYLPALTERTRW